MKCGFFKRFEPVEESKKSDLLTTDEEISSSNDVIDVSKECSKLDTDLREHVNLLSPLQPVLPYKLSQINNSFLKKNLNQTQKLIGNCEDEIYGFTPLNNELSTFQSSAKSFSLSSNNNNTNSNNTNNKYSNPIYSFYQEGSVNNNNNNNSINNDNYSRNCFTTSSSGPDSTSKLNNNNNNKQQTDVHDVFTSKLPPVPKRNSRNNLTNSNTSILNTNRYDQFSNGKTSSNSTSSNNAYKMTNSNNTSDSILLSSSSSSASTITKTDSPLISSNLSTISSSNIMKVYKR